MAAAVISAKTGSANAKILSHGIAELLVVAEAFLGGQGSEATDTSGVAALLGETLLTAAAPYKSVRTRSTKAEGVSPAGASSSACGLLPRRLSLA